MGSIVVNKISHTFSSILSNDKCRLFQLSFLMLFVELTLMRWSGSTILYLFFFSNFVLLASFLGMGIGFLRSKSSFRLLQLSPILLAILILLCYIFCYEYQARVNPKTGNLDYLATYFKSNAYPIFLTLPIIFLAIAAVMASIADGVARAFKKLPPLQAYRWEVLGSLLGIIIFSILSFLHASPVWWGIIISLLFIPPLIPKWKSSCLLLFIVQVGALALMVGIFSKESMTEKHFWSSYYKIEIQPYATNSYVVNVNGLPQQIIESVKQRRDVKPFYFLPYQHTVKQNTLDKVLIIGSGTGGDVAIALAQGAKQVDAVEIDPVLYQLGRKFNPDRPYFDHRVNAYINDGRAFFQQSTNKYSMIILALTDSLMLIPGQSSLRLENYLYTLESISRIYQLLKPDGVFTIYNYYHAPWLVDRLANTLAKVFKHAPCLDTYGTDDYWATVLSISPKQSALQCPTVWQAHPKEYANPSSDDHPFLYLKNNNLSILYIIGLGFVLFVSLFAIRITSGSFNAIKNYPDLFLMGSAFLLLETKNVINFALLFGTTWFVNALVFIGVLLTVYFAIEVKTRSSFLSVPILYGALCITLFICWLVPNSYLLSLSMPLRFFTATILAFGPVFIANLIFSERFSSVIDTTEAFGANLIGAMLGGVLEYASIAIGYRSLLILIAILYTFAILFMLFYKRPPMSIPITLQDARF